MKPDASTDVRGTFAPIPTNVSGIRISELLPRLDDVRRNVQSNHRSDEPPEEHMSSLMESFETLKEHFGDDQDATRIIDRETQSANQWMGENTPEEPKS